MDDEELSLPFIVHSDYNILKSATVKNAEGEDERIFDGIVSLESPDLEGETMVQKGMNLKPLLAFGHINYDHGTVRHHSPAYIIGEPREAKVVRAQSSDHGEVDGLYFKGMIYNIPGHKHLADDCWDHMQTLEKSKGTRRKMGASIEGKALIRHNRSRVARSDVYHLALTPTPMHPDTHVGIAALVKSIALVRELGPSVFAGHGATLNELAEALIKGDVIGDTDGDGTANVATIGGYSALLKEDLEHKNGGWRKRGKKGRLKQAATSIWGGAPCPNGCYNGAGRFSKGMDGARSHLTHCQGWDEDEADAFVKSLSGIFG